MPNTIGMIISTFCINVQLLGNGDLIMTNCVVRWLRLDTMSPILKAGNLYHKFQQNGSDGILLDDRDYPPSWLMAPFATIS